MAKSETKANELIEHLQMNDEIFEFIVEEDRAEIQSKLEPFSVYAVRKKVQLKNEFNDYLAKLQHGYQVIIQAIAAKDQKIK